MIRVLLVDDHPVVRSGVAALLGGESSIEVVGAAATGEEALRLVEDLAPDVVLCDLRLGEGLDGVGVTGGSAPVRLTEWSSWPTAPTALRRTPRRRPGRRRPARRGG